MDSRIYKYWGKARPATDAGPQWHLLVYHSLDVAAVGYILLQKNPRYLKHFQRLTGFDKQLFIKWFTFLLALHDIGKFADSFQNLNPEALVILQRRSSEREYSARHDSLGWFIWKAHLRQHCIDRGIFQVSGSNRRRITSEQPIDIWLSAMVGHHGEPPKPTLQHSANAYFEVNNDFAAATAFLDELIPLLLEQDINFPPCDMQVLQLASWWLSGLAVLSDWLGSNTRFFRYEDIQLPLSDYWIRAKKQAEQAIQETEILSCLPSLHLSLVDLIRDPSGSVPKATSLQQQMIEWPITANPHLFILEDVTGAGKTEAAVLLAHHLMQVGQGNSLYFALPTMATANTMYARMKGVYRKLFATDANPSLILAHGASDMVKEFRQSVLPKINSTADNYGDGTVPAGAHCNAWLADNRKKALLADIGIGTIDQALLAILPARHQSLRLLGLLDKILVVDEVHACDAYMHELLCALLRAHAAAGGSAILLSATLPIRQRQALVEAYAQGHGLHTPTLQAVDEHSYPLVTGFTESDLQETVVATRSSVQREAKVKFLAEQQDVEDRLAETVAKGQCICWIRNSVKDAIEAYEHIKAQYPDWDIDLFHARFALADRLTIENRVVNRFGKHSTAESRRGQILIATQVVQESLDLDFDDLITDLVPIDLIIQRAGRLRRHTRDALGNPIQGQDQRGGVVLHIYSPPATDSPKSNWYAGFFPNAKKVYGHHGQLWLTAKLLHRAGKFRMPEDARTLIEGVYGVDAQENIPQPLLHRSNESEGSDRADASLARLNALAMELGYSDDFTNHWWDEAKTPTRLGEPTTTVYLARWQVGILAPWSEDKKHPWPLSAVSMRTFWIAAEATTPEITQQQIDECKVQLPAKGKWGVLLPLVQVGEEDWQGWAIRKINGKDERICFFYNESLGLRAAERQE